MSSYKLKKADETAMSRKIKINKVLTCTWKQEHSEFLHSMVCFTEILQFIPNKADVPQEVHKPRYSFPWSSISIYFHN